MTGWITFLMAAILQGVLLVMCLAWKVRQRKLHIDDFGNPLDGEPQRVEIRVDAESVETVTPHHHSITVHRMYHFTASVPGRLHDTIDLILIHRLQYPNPSHMQARLHPSLPSQRRQQQTEDRVPGLVDDVTSAFRLYKGFSCFSLTLVVFLHYIYPNIISEHVDRFLETVEDLEKDGAWRF